MANPIIPLIDIEASTIGFKKKGSCWYNKTSELTYIIDFQKSSWGKCGYINLGVSINDIAIMQYPKMRDCHLRFRADRFIDDSNSLDQALDYDEFWKITEEDRREVIRLALCSAKMYFFSQLDSIGDLKRFVLANSEHLNRLNGPGCAYLKI